jgi:hypothetical protein
MNQYYSHPLNYIHPSYPSSIDLPEIDWEDFWENYWNNLKNTLRLKLLYELESPEETRLRILQEEAIKAELAKKAAWAPVVPAIITAGFTALIIYIYNKKRG